MHHNSGERFQKTAHEKAKIKKKKPKEKYSEEPPTRSADEVMQKTLDGFSRRGTQTFALSPFSQYFDDWLINLRQLISDFEANVKVHVDEEFTAKRVRVLADVEEELAKLRIQEAELDSAAKDLSASNHLLVEMDAAYAGQSRGLSEKRNSELESLTKNVHDLEGKLAAVEQMKTKFFGFSKKDKTKRLEDATSRLNTAKKELEMATQNFKVEQDKLHDDYTNRKMATIEKVQALEMKISDIETDRSIEVRQVAVSALIEAIKTLQKRKHASATSKQ